MNQSTLPHLKFNFALFPIAMLVLFLVLGFVSLLMFRKTRAFATGVLGVGLLVALMAMFWLSKGVAVHPRYAAEGYSQSQRNFQVNLSRASSPRQAVTAPPIMAPQPLLSPTAEVADDEQFLSPDEALRQRESPAATISSATTTQPATSPPAWIRQTEIDFDHEPHTIVVHSGPWKSQSECALEIQKQLRLSLAAYYDWFLLHHERQLPANSQMLPVESDIALLQQLDTFSETTTHPSFGEMQQLHVRFAVPPSFVTHLERRVKDVLVGDRLRRTGLATGAVLAGLSVAFGGLKMRQSTRRATSLRN